MRFHHLPFSGWHAKAGLLVLFVLAISGCGIGGKPTGTVTGTVTYKNEPVTAGMVTFITADGQSATAPIGADGSYDASGVPLGSVKVTVTTPSAGPTAEQAAKNPLMTKKGFVPKGEKTVSIPKKYSVPATSGLGLTVSEGSQTFDINLK